MLKHSTSLGTLFGRSVCPLFLATALVVAPSVARGAEIIIDLSDILNETNGGTGSNDASAGDTLILDEGVTMTLDDDHPGLVVENADGATVINNGIIYTTGTCDYSTNGSYAGTCNTGDGSTRSYGYADGMHGRWSNNLLMINNGQISVGDLGGSGMYFGYGGNNATMINNGSIFAREEMGENYDEVINGVVETITRTQWGAGQMLIWAFDLGSSDATTGHLMVNTGLIQSEVIATHGMYLDSDNYHQVGADASTNEYIRYLNVINSAMYNYGTIRNIATGFGTQENYTSGMVADAHEVDLYNYGLIHIVPYGRGMEAAGSGNRVFNYGTIIMDGQNALLDDDAFAPSYGIESYVNRMLSYDVVQDDLTSRDTSHRNLVVNAGTVRMTSSNAVGMAILGGGGHDLYNYGRVEAPHGWSLRLNTGSSQVANTINLLDGSILVGDVLIDQSSADNMPFFLGDGLNAAVRFDTDVPTSIATQVSVASDITSRNGYVLLNDVLFTVDLESYYQQDRVAWSLFSTIQNIVDASVDARPPAGDFAFNGGAEGRMSENWATMFSDWVYDPGDDDVTYLDRDADHEAAFIGYSAGTIIGVNKSDRSYFAGAAYSSTSGEEDVDYSTYSGTLFGGATATFKDRFDVSLTAGVAFNQTNRDMADNRVSSGIDKSSANYASVFLAPSLRVNGPISGSSFRLNYLGSWHQEHSYELYGGEQLSVDQRFSNVIGAQLQMAHDLPMITESFPTRVRYGVEGSYANGQSIDSTLTLSGFSTTGPGLSTEYDNGFTARGFAALEVGPTFIEASYGTDEQVSINAGLKLRF